MEFSLVFNDNISAVDGFIGTNGTFYCKLQSTEEELSLVCFNISQCLSRRINTALAVLVLVLVLALVLVSALIVGPIITSH
jgi:hypothetical protein